MSKIHIELENRGVRGLLTITAGKVEITEFCGARAFKRELEELVKGAIADGVRVRERVCNADGNRIECFRVARSDDPRFTGSLRDLINRHQFEHGVCFASSVDEDAHLRVPVRGSKMLEGLSEPMERQTRDIPWVRVPNRANRSKDFNFPFADGASGSRDKTCIIDISSVKLPDGVDRAMLMGGNFYGSACRSIPFAGCERKEVRQTA